MPESKYNEEEMASIIKERRFSKPKKFLPLTSPSLAQTHCQGPLMVNGSGKSLNDEELLDIKKELEELKVQHGWREPERKFMDDPFTVWMFDGVPDYSLTNYFFLKERTHVHGAGSLEEIVENLVKSWEMERSHKPDCTQHETTDPDKFAFSANGGKVFNNVEAHQAGNYNVLLNSCPREYYDAENMTWQDSHHAFHKAFPAFPWEVLEVQSGPPKVEFTWRHWAHFTGSYKGVQGQGQLIEMFGSCTAVLNDKMQIGELVVNFDPVKFFKDLMTEDATDNESKTASERNGDDQVPPPRISSVSGLSGLTDDLTELSMYSGDEEKSQGSRRGSPTASSSGGGCPFAHS